MLRPEDLDINISHIKVSGIGGLGMVAIVAVMAYTMPAVRSFVFLSVAGGVIGGLTLIVYRWARPAPPHGPTLDVDR